MVKQRSKWAWVILSISLAHLRVRPMGCIVRAGEQTSKHANENDLAAHFSIIDDELLFVGASEAFTLVLVHPPALQPPTVLDVAKDYAGDLQAAVKKAAAVVAVAPSARATVLLGPHTYVLRTKPFARRCWPLPP